MGWTSAPVLEAGTVDVTTTGPVEVENATGTVLANSEQQFTAASGVVCPPSGATVTLVDLATVFYPAGLGIANYHTAIVSLAGNPPINVNVDLLDNEGFIAWQTTVRSSEDFVQIIVPLPTGGLMAPDAPLLQLTNNGANSVDASVRCNQSVLGPSTSQQPIGASGAPAPYDTVQVGGSDGTDLRTFATDFGGVLYTRPTVPDSNGAPPTEVLSANSFTAVANANWIPAPGANKRIRLFGLSLAVQSGSSGGAMSISFTDSGGNTSGVRVAVGFATSDNMGGQIPDQGIACATNTPVAIAVAGTISCAARAVWTVEPG